MLQFASKLSEFQPTERLVNSKHRPAKERGPGGVQCQRTSQS